MAGLKEAAQSVHGGKWLIWRETSNMEGKLLIWREIANMEGALIWREGALIWRQG